MNTKRQGVINFLIYRERGDSKYTAVCLDFDIVEKGSNLEKLKKSIEEAAALHLESVINDNLADDLINRHAPLKYWDKLHCALSAYDKMLRENKTIKPQKSEPIAIRDIWNRNSKELVAA